MNFRILAGSIRPRGQILALLAASALSATLIASGAQAQQPAPGAPKAAQAPAPAAPKAPPKAAPKGPAGAPAAQAPAAGAPPAAAAQPPEQQVQLIYAPWTKFCLKGQE